MGAEEEMSADRTEAIRALLVEAERAHGTYEATELNGVYDEDWPRWYAAYAVEHGIGALLGAEVTSDRLAAFLAGTNSDFERLEPKPGEPWSAYTARRIASEL